MATGGGRLSALVERDEDTVVSCLKNLLLLDGEPIAHPADMDTIEQLSRNNTQLIVNKLFALPKTSTSDGVVVTLPSTQIYHFPRAHHVPTEKPKTRWERFAETKGIQKTKRSRLVWDEIAQDWRPRFGFMSVKKTRDKVENAVVEVKKNQDPFEDPFDRLSDEKQLRKGKQSFRELRNRAEASGVRIKPSGGAERGGSGKKALKNGRDVEAAGDVVVAPVGVAPLGSDVNNRKRGAQGLKEVMTRAQMSTASVGRFDKLARLEKKEPQHKRRKVDDRSLEEERSMMTKAAQLVVKKANRNLIDTTVSESVVSMETQPEGKGRVAREMKGKSDMKRAAANRRKPKGPKGGASGKKRKK